VSVKSLTSKQNKIMKNDLIVDLRLMEAIITSFSPNSGRNSPPKNDGSIEPMDCLKSVLNELFKYSEGTVSPF
jgi:hypothetical protein